ncbi:hypothetical protein [Thalassobacillus hwangdonensis]|uniref:DUF4328 domain-containing protein n=1 Tax=Thalassobacillus hwangdonensis TaxID=546108 RepID=A0ABW3L1X8_9BACI
MRLESDHSVHLLKGFIILTFIALFIEFFTSLIYIIDTELYRKIEMLDVIGIWGTFVFYFIQGILFLIWLYKVHKDLNAMDSYYPVSPWGSFARVIVPVYNLYGLWNVYATMYRHFKQYDRTEHIGQKLYVYLPIFYIGFWGTNIFNNSISGDFGVPLTISFLLDMGMMVIYLLMVKLITRALHLLRDDYDETYGNPQQEQNA